MPHKLRALPAILLSAAALALAGCGSDDGDPPAEGATVPLGAQAEAPAAADAETTETPAAVEDEWVTITDVPSGITFAMPRLINPQANTATVSDGTAVALRNYSTVTSDNIEVGLNVIDTSGEGYDFDAGVEGVAATLGGEIVSRTPIEVAGSPAVDVEMTYGDGYVVFFQLVTGDEHIVQSLASGPESEREAIESTYIQLNESVAVG